MAGLLGVAMLTSAAQPSVLIAAPFLGLSLVRGVRRPMGWAAALLAMVVVTSGIRDGMWYAERAWAVLMTGGFLAWTLRRPHASFTSRALAAVGLSVGSVGALLLMRPGGWNALDQAVRDRMAGGVETALRALQVLRDGQALPQTVVVGIYETVEAQATVFPALLGVGSMAALGVAWWAHRRIGHGERGSLDSLAGFRFNDHLVWILVVGLVLLVVRWGDGLARVGANAFVFMGALYAARGAGVVLFLSGGLSVAGYALLAFGLVFVPPVVLAGAMVIGLGDTWLDIRSSIKDLAA